MPRPQRQAKVHAWRRAWPRPATVVAALLWQLAFHQLLKEQPLSSPCCRQQAHPHCTSWIAGRTAWPVRCSLPAVHREKVGMCVSRGGAGVCAWQEGMRGHLCAHACSSSASMHCGCQRRPQPRHRRGRRRGAQCTPGVAIRTHPHTHLGINSRRVAGGRALGHLEVAQVGAEQLAGIDAEVALGAGAHGLAGGAATRAGLGALGARLPATLADQALAGDLRGRGWGVEEGVRGMEREGELRARWLRSRRASAARYGEGCEHGWCACSGPARAPHTSSRLLPQRPA